MAKKESATVESIFNRGFLKLLLIVGLIITAGASMPIIKEKAAKAKKTSYGQCEQVPEGFPYLKLPYKMGCWVIKLNPKQFTGKVYLNPMTYVTLDWELNTPAQIRDRFGKIIEVKHQQGVHLEGDSHRFNTLQFRGTGTVTIYAKLRSR